MFMTGVLCTVCGAQVYFKVVKEKDWFFDLIMLTCLGLDIQERI